MIDEALIKITVNTEEDSVKFEIINLPEMPPCTLSEFYKDHPGLAIACRIVGKINQEIKAIAENIEKEHEKV